MNPVLTFLTATFKASFLTLTIEMCNTFLDRKDENRKMSTGDFYNFSSNASREAKVKGFRVSRMCKAVRIKHVVANFHLAVNYC